MIFHDSAQSYARPVSKIGVRQHLARGSAWELPGGAILWKAIGKVALVVCVATISVNMLFGAYKGHLATVATAVEGQRHELMDRNITLRAARAGMLTPQSVELVAGKALSLYAPQEGQRYIYNRVRGRFDRL